MEAEDSSGGPAEGVPCARCGYSLAGLLKDDRCPECGEAIAWTMSVRARRLPPGPDARRLARGCMLLAIAGWVGLAATVLLIVNHRMGSWAASMAWVVGWLIALGVSTWVNAWGWTLVAITERGIGERPRGDPLALGTGTMPAVLNWLGACCWLGLGVMMLWEAPRRGVRGGDGPETALALGVIVTSIVKAPAGLLALRRLARFGPGLAFSARLPVVATCAGIIFAVGGLLECSTLGWLVYACMVTRVTLGARRGAAGLE